MATPTLTANYSGYGRYLLPDEVQSSLTEILAGLSSATGWDITVGSLTTPSLTVSGLAANTVVKAGTGGALTSITNVNSAVLVTSAGGVPSLSTDIPTAVTIGAAYIYRAGGTDVATADGGTALSAIGAADTVLSVNDAGTALAYRALGVGTSGTDFAIVATDAGGFVFNLPDAGASARGAVTTGTQTFAGAKTFSTALTVSGTGGSKIAGSLSVNHTNTPANTLDVRSTATNSSGVISVANSDISRYVSIFSGSSAGDAAFFWDSNLALRFGTATSAGGGGFAEKGRWAASGGFYVGTGGVDAGAGSGRFQGTLTADGAFGCNGATAQTAYASGGALNAYTTGAFGLDSDANMSALHAMVVSIRAALVANGILS